jgi:hypothetical protein
MKLYLVLYAKFCGLLLGCVVLLGFICPALISSDDMLFVAVGFVLLLAVPPAVAIFAWHSYQHLQQLMKDQSNEKASSTRRRRPV